MMNEDDMEIDYYQILEVDPNVSHDEIKKAYKNLAKKWNPYKNRLMNREAIKFIQISEAFEVLSDPEQRAAYDNQYYDNQYYDDQCYDDQCYDDQYYDDQYCDDQYYDDDLAYRREEASKAFPAEIKLPCSLEELYTGTTKQKKLSIEVPGIDGKSTREEETLTIDIKPGLTKGTKLTFTGKGRNTMHPNGIRGDLVFIIDEKPHHLYVRKENDLVVTLELRLTEALIGYNLNLVTLDGRTLNIPINNVTSSNYEHVVPGEGMPIYTDPTKRGDLRIKFIIRFPKGLSEEQKADIKTILGSANFS